MGYKILIFLIDLIYWLGIFIIPAGIFFFASLWIYYEHGNRMFWPSVLLVIGILTGILLAEYIRKHYGLNNFWSRLSATADVDNKKE